MGKKENPLVSQGYYPCDHKASVGTRVSTPVLTSDHDEYR